MKAPNIFEMFGALVCALGMRNNLAMEVRYRLGGQELLAEDEGVRRETEFEVSRRQNLGQTNRNCMQGVLETDKFLY